MDSGLPEYFKRNVESLSQKAQEILISFHLLREFHCNISSVFHRNSMSIVKLYLSSSFATLKSRSMFVSSAECSLYLERNISVSLELAAISMND